MDSNPDGPPAAAAPRGERQEVALAAGRARLAFGWIGDRWEHRVTIDGRLVARSVEDAGSGDDPRWPASPVLVELSQLVVAGRPALLAVGLAGRSHFSASIVPAPDLPDTLLFEIACRLQERPVRLLSTYAAGGGIVRVSPATAVPQLPGTAQWAYTIGPEGIRATGPTIAAETR
jgi:hypothetical protein